MGKDQDLIEGARNGDYPVVEKILNQRAKRSGPLASLRRGPGANAQDSNGFSALHHAALNRHKDIVQLLLSHEASTNIVDHQGSSPLHLAAWSGNEDIVRLLLTHGPSVPNVNLTNRSLETALHMAAQYGHTGVVKMLLHHGADPTIINQRQETALDLAAQYGRLEAVQILLQSHPGLIAPYTKISSSNRPHQCPYPQTPLHSASRNGHRSVVEVLVKAGFDVNVRTSQGTALHEAALCGKLDVLKTLLEANIDVCIADSNRRTAVDRLNEVGLKTPVAKEMAELIRGALKKSVTGKASSPMCSPYDGTPSPTGMKDGKLPLSQIHDNHSHSDAESGKASRNSYSPSQSPKMNSFSRGKARRSVDIHLVKGPDSDRVATGPPKKPPRRNLSASPTHPGVPDFSGDQYDLMQLAHMGRNKSLDEGVYGERWRKSITGYETSQSTDSIDLSPMDHLHHHHHHKQSAKNDIAFFNGLADSDAKNKSKSQHLALDSQYVSVAHIKLRDAKSEQNVSPSGLRIMQGRSTDDLDHIDMPSSHLPPAPPFTGATNTSALIVDTTGKGKTSTMGSSGSGSGQDEKKKPIPKGPKPAIAPKPTNVPPTKPKNIKRQGNSCDNVLDESKQSKGNAAKKTTTKSTSMSVLSPVDLDKEWEGITKFMDSLNVKMGDRAENGTVRSSVGKWLASVNMSQYEQLLLSAGFDDVEFLGGGILEENSLLEIGMLNAQHRKIVSIHASKLEVSWPRALGTGGVPLSVDKWLQELHLDNYVDAFKKNRYKDPDRLLRLTNDELLTLLEIEPLGHRQRILAASSRLSPTNSLHYSGRTSFSHFENGVATNNSNNHNTQRQQESDDGSLPLRDPNDLVSGVSSALKTAWRHTPETLINGSVTYKAVYVGWSPVQEFSTTECIQKAIQQIRSQEVADLSLVTKGKLSGNAATMVNINVTLIVSATVVSWYNAKTKNLVGEHDIGSIQCTCQASDDLRHLALVTRATDPADRTHSCHVFLLDSVEIATETILTLGQAFEVAYQLALASRKPGKDHKTHTRSKSANQLSTKSIHSSSFAPNSASGVAPVGITGGGHSKAKRERFIMQSSCSSGNVVTSASNGAHCRSQSVHDIPPPVISAVSAKSATNSPQIDIHHSQQQHHKDYREPFNFSSHSNLTRAPLVSKEEL